MAALAALPAAASATASPPTCRLPGVGGHAISHVIEINFDNVHLSRDNPNVPSDLEQMPNLLNFIENNGTLLSNDHTPLVSHTANDLMTTISGMYGDEHGMPIANEYQVYNPDGSTFTAGSFAYWTDPVVSYANNLGNSSDPMTTLVGPTGKIPPAPWVPYTRAGCNFGSVAMANTELENTSPDIAHVFGANSPQAAEARSDPSLAQTDYMGLSIHCAAGAALCAQGANNSVADPLADEPGGYHGFRALFGAKNISPAVTGGHDTVTNLDGQPITDSHGHPGFPGYNGMQPWNSLAYTLALQEHGVPVTYTYVSSAHENPNIPPNGVQWGPGQLPYVEQLQAFDRAFKTFFQRLAAAGITSKNTLFEFGSDENDHFVASSPAPANCNGTGTPCSYSQIGEIDENVKGLLSASGIDTSFGIAADSAPEFYLQGQPSAEAPGVRQFEQALAAVKAQNPYTGGTDALTQYLADPTEMRILHMVTGDPRRTPTVAMFANPNYWVYNGGPSCGGSCSSFDSEAWNHGDVQPDITHTWSALVGPGVAHLGQAPAIWTDHTDLRPTMLALLDLRDDYTDQGRVVEEVIQSAGETPAASTPDYVALARAYKQIEAPVGALGMRTLAASTKAIESDSPGDRTYHSIDSELLRIGTQRDALAAAMIGLLDGAAFHDRPIDHTVAVALEHEAEALIARAQALI
jgi:hypothetical protein